MENHVHNLKFLRQARQDLRINETPQEQIPWDKLRRKNSSYKFKRQHSIGNFITDFYCPAKKLVIEIDGSQHLDNKEPDKERTEYFENLGIKVIRFWNNEIDKNIEGVMVKIKAELNCVTPHPPIS